MIFYFFLFFLFISFFFFFFFFFFQAEDGIRDLTVTGVQMCALPISETPCCPRHLQETPLHGIRRTKELIGMKRACGLHDTVREPTPRRVTPDHARSRHVSGRTQRSEERRVGKGWSVGR